VYWAKCTLFSTANPQANRTGALGYVARGAWGRRMYCVDRYSLVSFTA
jgi:hypothetical protein